MSGAWAPSARVGAPWTPSRAMRAYPSNCSAIGWPATGPFARTSSTALRRPSGPRCRSRYDHVDNGRREARKCIS